MTLKIYSIQVSGIKCTNCAGKIKTAIGEKVPETVKVTVNVIQEKVYVTLDNDLLLLRIHDCLKDIGFPALGEAVLVAGGQDAERTIHFIFRNPTEEVLERVTAKVGSLAGVTKSSKTEFHNPEPAAPEDKEYKVSATYNCEIIKGREIIDEVEQIGAIFMIWNERVDGARNQPKIVLNKRELYECIILVSYFMIFNMILPETGEWY